MQINSSFWLKFAKNKGNDPFFLSSKNPNRNSFWDWRLKIYD